MRSRKIPTGTPMPKALVCALLEDNKRFLFLVRKDRTGIEKIELPCVLVPSGRSPFAEIKALFPQVTGIDGEIGEIVLEGKHNAGSRKKKNVVPALAFKVTAKNKSAKVSKDFSGFKWLSFEDFRKYRLGRNAERLLKL